MIILIYNTQVYSTAVPAERGSSRCVLRRSVLRTAGTAYCGTAEQRNSTGTEALQWLHANSKPCNIQFSCAGSTCEKAGLQHSLGWEIILDTCRAQYSHQAGHMRFDHTQMITCYDLHVRNLNTCPDTYYKHKYNLHTITVLQSTKPFTLHNASDSVTSPHRMPLFIQPYVTLIHAWRIPTSTTCLVYVSRSEVPAVVSSEI